ncbi:DUF192 domain-containing protein [uncultured Roseobacter sp.]|uniref:DUF192 domain-containing protein n=1 Tax=uncultured Roseobacter sp. TaxID=114847 RepID=UPI0026356D51|nr:DUF192 domain-containing protein [uncultured Roseobacter sp.]
MSLRLAALVLLLGQPAAAEVCRNDTVFLRGDWGTARFSVEIADDDAERAQGLMHRDSMPVSAGMLFVYERPQGLSFWMRNTLIPLDMLFIDPQGVVRHIHHRAIPLDETPISGGKGLTHVLEINGGMAESLGISVGSQVRHPSFQGTGTAWPC